MSVEFETTRKTSAGHPEGNRYLLSAADGSFRGTGPNGAFEGSVRNAADWVTQHSDHSMSLDVRAELVASDGTTILMTYQGVSANGVVHTAPRFSAPTDSDYAWINHLVCLSIGTLGDRGVSYEVYTFG